MRYDEYLRAFLSLEDRLLEVLRDIPYAEASESLYSEKINLLLLSTCPVIESYLSERAVSSRTVKNHPLWNWEYTWKIWEKQNKAQRLKVDSQGRRKIPSSFPKFTYIAHEVFGISFKQISMYRFDRVKHLPNPDEALVALRPFGAFANATSFQEYDGVSGFPSGYRTPDWWSAYNKIKHDMSAARGRVTFKSIVEALGGLFLILACCDPDIDLLQANGYLYRRGDVQTFESRVYRYRIS